MPIYEFRCQDCGHVHEALRRMGEGPQGLTCPECASKKLSQEYSTFAASSGSSGEPSCGAAGTGCGGGGGGG